MAHRRSNRLPYLCVAVLPWLATDFSSWGRFPTTQAGPPPRLYVRSTPSPLKHDGTDASQSFAPQRWELTAPAGFFGAFVSWECEGFRHVDDPDQQADVQLDLKVLRSERAAGWGAVRGSDRTNLKKGYGRAIVNAVSRRAGSGEAELIVTFVEDPRNVVAAGEYEAVVVATMTEN